MLAMVAARGPEKSVDPTEIARALAGPKPEAWSHVMLPLRRVARQLAREGRIVILRKGKPADPDDFKGIYRLAMPRHD